MKKIAIMIITIFTVLLSACADGNSVRLKKSADDYLGIDYENVVAELDGLGFESISVVPVEDLRSSEIRKEGSVTNIAIDGSDDFSANTLFSKDVQIVITYHTIHRINMPLSPDDISNMTPEEMEEVLTEAGYTEVGIEDVYDLDPDESEVDSYSELTINDKSFEQGESIPYDADIKIRRHLTYAKYDLQLSIVFTPNLFFDKYDVEASVDDEPLATMVHGTDWKGSLRLKEGSYTIDFRNKDDHSVAGKVTIDLTSDTDAEYKIACKSDEITVKEIHVYKAEEVSEDEIRVPFSKYDLYGENYKEVMQSLEDMGFTNIVTEPVYDIYIGITERETIERIVFGDNDNITRGEILKKDVKVSIRYHLSYTEDPEYIEEQKRQEEQAARENETETTTEEEEDPSYSNIEIKNYKGFNNIQSYFIQICDPDDMEPVFDLAKARGLYILQTDNGDLNSYAISSEKYQGSSWWNPSFSSDYVTLHYSNVSDVSGHRFVYHFADGKGEIEYSSSRGIEGGRYSNVKDALKDYLDR